MTTPAASCIRFFAGIFLILSSFGVTLFHFGDSFPGIAALELAMGAWMASEGLGLLAHGGGNIFKRVANAAQGITPPKP